MWLSPQLYLLFAVSVTYKHRGSNISYLPWLPSENLSMECVGNYIPCTIVPVLNARGFTFLPEYWWTEPSENWTLYAHCYMSNVRNTCISHLVPAPLPRICCCVRIQRGRIHTGCVQWGVFLKTRMVRTRDFKSYMCLSEPEPNVSLLPLRQTQIVNKWYWDKLLIPNGKIIIFPNHTL